MDYIRRDLLEMNDGQVLIFLDRIKEDIWSSSKLAEACESYFDEDYMPDGWEAEFGDFLNRIPQNDIYWIK